MLYGTSDREFSVTRASENKTTVDQVLRRPKDRLAYEYDFGDSWVHDVILAIHGGWVRREPEE